MRILITGGRSQVAQEMVRLYTEKGHTCIVTGSKDMEGLKELYKTYSKVEFLLFDLYSPEKSVSELERLLTAGISACVLNAATEVKEKVPLHCQSQESIDQELNGNLKGNIFLLQKVLIAMKESKFGRLLLISSLGVSAGLSNYPLYCMSKGGLEALFVNLAIDYGRLNILSNIIRPGIIKTERNKDYWTRPAYSKKISRYIPQGELGEARHIAKASMPMIDEDSYINGSVLNVSGGLPLTSATGIVAASSLLD